MRHLFFDTNILLDFLANREPFAKDAALLFNLSLQKKLTIYVAAISYNNIYYILRQTKSHIQAIQILSQLQELTEVVNLNKEIIKLSLQSDFKDFEDAIQHYCALENKFVEAIVTRNSKDFNKSKVAIFNPTEALAFIKNKT